MKLQGIFPPLTTPFDHNGDIWKIKVEHNVSKLNLTGLAGYVVIGSTGESKLLTTDEKLRLWEWVAKYAAPEKILIAGKRPRDGRTYKSRGGSRLQGCARPDSALLQRPGCSRCGSEAVLLQRRRSGEDSRNHL